MYSHHAIRVLDTRHAADGAVGLHNGIMRYSGDEHDSGDGSGGGSAESGERLVGGSPDDEGSLTAMVEQPARIMRIGTMIKQLLEEVRSAPLDEPGRTRMREIYATSLRELKEGLSGDLRDELDHLTLPFDDDAVPSDAELRVAQAQLVGWLEGLFHGIQTALMAQQMATQAQLTQMRQLPQSDDATAGQPRTEQRRGTGQYL